MGGFLYRMRQGLTQFMAGRNGPDQLGTALLGVDLLVALVRTPVIWLTRSPGVNLVFSLVFLAVWALWAFRVFSRNLPRRREENARFLRWLHRARGRLDRMRDREHRYFTCPGCKATCRVPRGKGKLRITCPKCGRVMEKRT